MADFSKKIDFDEKLININKRLSEKKKHVEDKKTVNDNITSNIELITDAAREVKLMPTKEFTKDLISKYGSFKSAKYFSLDRSQNCLVSNHFLVTLHLEMVKFVRINLEKWQKKVLICHLQQTLVLIQKKSVNKIKEKQNLKESVESKIVYLLLTEL